MNKKSALRGLLAAVNKPKIQLPKEQKFISPLVESEVMFVEEGVLASENSTQEDKSTNPQGVKSTTDEESTADLKVTCPTDEKGTHPEGVKSTHFKESSSKNSFKDSLSCSLNFPDDMTARWRTFEKSGKFSNSKKEREIFKNLFSIHGDQFFEQCGKVVAFLEEQGTRKAGEEGRIHSPMVWIDGHWERNLSQYQAWIAKQQVLQDAQDKMDQQDARRSAQQRELEAVQQKEKQELEERQSQMELDTQRFLRFFPSECEVKAFVEQAVERPECDFTQNSWRKLGWESPVVRTCVISHFLKVESKGFTTTSLQNPLSLSEATA